MLAGSGIGITGAASTVVRDNLAKNVVLVSNDKGKIAASPLSINSFQSVVTGGATTITDYDLTPNKVVISDAAGKVSTSAVSNIEVGYLAGTNDSIQNQLDSKANQSTTYTKTEVDDKLILKAPLYQDTVRVGTSTVFSDLTRGAAGELLWDNSAMASEALVSQVQNDLQINLNATVSYVQANFQGKLASVNESTTDAVILQSLDDSDLHIAWTVAPNASYTNQTGFQTITQSSTTSGYILARPGGQVPVPGAALRFSVELKAGTKTEIVIHNDDVTNISSRASFQQSLTNTWQTVVWEYGPTSTNRFSLYFGLTDGQYTQSPGTYYLRNLRVTQPDIVVNFSQDVAITGQCTAQAFVTSSDERIKGDVQLVDPAKCLQIVKSIPPKIYTRTDLGESQEDPERRIGVIAQDVARAVPAEWKNVVYYQDKSLAVDYSRLSALLLGAVQSLSTRLEALETNNLT
jgi:hypothetical protein